MTTSINPELTLAQSIFKEVIWQPMIKAGEVWLDGVEATVPILDLPLFQDLEDGLINSLMDTLFNMLILTVDITAIQLINPARQSAYASANEALKLIALEKGVDSSEFIQAQNAAIATQIQLTNFIGH